MSLAPFAVVAIVGGVNMAAFGTEAKGKVLEEFSP